MLIESVHERIRALEPGSSIGVSDWLVISQSMISAFGATTLDPDPMHLDPVWAANNGPFGGSIAYGFLTISLLTTLFNSAVGDPHGADRHSDGYYLNYGFDRVRLVAPVAAGSRIRGRFTIAGRSQDERGRWLTTFDFTVEIEGQERPALVGQWLFMWVPPND